MFRLTVEGEDGNGGRGQPECVLKARVTSLDFIQVSHREALVSFEAGGT